MSLPMYEIAGAINRINNPGWAVIEYALWTSSSSFFRNKPNIGIEQDSNKKNFELKVHLKQLQMYC